MADAPAVIVVGAGLSGLTCALHLQRNGAKVTVIEASDAPGGRARTDEAGGFLLDRGFQVLLTSYPEAARLLDYRALEVRPFYSGALVRYRGKFTKLSDPWKHPQDLVQTAFSPLATTNDKLRVAQLLMRTSKAPQPSARETTATAAATTIEELRENGFSSHFIDGFFRPFFGGIFLERELQTYSPSFDFLFRMFAQGSAVLPRFGMGQLGRQLASMLSPGTLRLSTPATEVSASGVQLASGEKLRADHVVLAVDNPSAKKLANIPARDSKAVTCIYFSCERAPIHEPILLLNAEEGPINNMCFPSQVSESYAPSGAALASVTVLGAHDDESALERSVREQLREWFGPSAQSWKHLRTYQIKHALPAEAPQALRLNIPTVFDGIYLCGDYMEHASINGAMLSGRRTAEALIGSTFLKR